ncbi:MAG: branched-chain amino acid ABC transporter permease [Pedosphaera sp.]|nr:branched-chain amino acid ABC transporter permease [Pedosphaera sp.]MST01140.1 branched-chain amino acid ABC transporter permease [Pedosphaera sp.]
MTEAIQQLVNGLSLGSIYALIALGYTMVYGVLRFINFAHGDVFMLGAFAGLFLYPLAGRQPSIGGAVLILVLAMAICAAIGILIERLAYRPLRERPRLNVLITAIGVSLLIEYGGQHQAVLGKNPRTFPDLLPSTNFSVGGAVFGSHQLIVLGLTLLLLVALRFIVLKTRIGMAMRAVSFNPQAAALMGVNINVVISFTFGLGSALAAAGGILYAMNYPSIEPLMGVMPGLKAFVAAVLGGIGSLPGAALGGLVLGLIETLIKSTRWSNYADAVAFAVLILILLFRPAGLLGKTEVEKV